jgi:nickel-dependent lactate racemase
VAAFAGSHEPVFESVCEATRRAFAVNLEKRADLVIASCGGHPWDINLLQLHKGLRNAALTARDGGAVVLVAEGGQGVGSPTLEAGLLYSSWREADAAARRRYVLNAHTAVALLQQAGRVSIHMVSEVAGLACAGKWATYHEDPQAALRAALDHLPMKNPLTYYMPLASITVPESLS